MNQCNFRAKWVAGGLLSTGLLSGCLLWTAVAGAQDDTRIEKEFRKFDRDGNGTVSPAELPQPQLFQRLDQDGDGQITLAETRAAVRAGLLNRDNAPDSTQLDEPLRSSVDELQSSGHVAAEIRQGPVEINPAAAGVGRMVDDFALQDVNGKRVQLADFKDRTATVLALTGTGCPLCLKYAPTLAALEQAFASRGVAFVYINPNAAESTEKLQQAIASHGFQGPYVKDEQKRILRQLAARTTTEVFVLDQARTLVYRGAVDDQYGLGYALDAPRKTFLRDALEAVLAGKQPDVAATTAPGCELFYEELADQPVATTITYHNRISRIIQNNCLECHRAAGNAPMPLETYGDVKDYGGMIRSVVEREVMPPWFAAPMHNQPTGKVPAAKHWANDRSLSQADKTDLMAWVAAGMPAGDSQDAPLPRVFPDNWLIGQPDAVFEFAEPFPVQATGTMPYQYVTVDTHLAEDQWVQAIEIQPGDASVVHHVIVSLQTDQAEGGNDEGSGFWGVYVPGNSTLVYPAGIAKFLPKGAKLRFQMHYTPNGTATQDRTRIGIIFATETPRHEVKVFGIAKRKISIPAGASHHPEQASIKLPQDVQLLGFLPHMHLRGQAARYEVTTAAGEVILLDVPRYDFNWQLLYRLAEPKSLRAGDTLRFTAWYDNSADNPANPDPTKTVTWGPQTYDEMHLGYVEYIVPDEDPISERGAASADMRRARLSSAIRDRVEDGLFRRLDANGDGLVTRAEVQLKLPGNAQAAGPIFDRLDSNGDGQLDPIEFSKL